MFFETRRHIVNDIKTRVYDLISVPENGLSLNVALERTGFGKCRGYFGSDFSVIT